MDEAIRAREVQQRLCCFTFWDVVADNVQEVDGRVEVADFQEGFLLLVHGFAEVEVVVQLGCLRKSQTLQRKMKCTSVTKAGNFSFFVL